MKASPPFGFTQTYFAISWEKEYVKKKNSQNLCAIGDISSFVLLNEDQI